MDLNYAAIAVATVAAFLSAFAYYAVLGNLLVAYGSAAPQRPPAWIVPIELLRTLVLTVVVAGIAAKVATADWFDAVQLALALWVGFPAVLLSGSVVHENVNPKLAALHSGDWLLKLLVITLIVTLWS